MVEDKQDDMETGFLQHFGPAFLVQLYGVPQIGQIGLKRHSSLYTHQRRVFRVQGVSSLPAVPLNP